MTDAVLMSHSGGGGSETRVWVVRAGRWSPVFARMLDSVTDINDAVENSCPGTAPLTIVVGRDHSIDLLADECASGQTRVARSRFNGHRFVE